MELTDKPQKIKKIAGLIIMPFIALLHIFNIGKYLDGFWLTVYLSYFSDLLIPFGIYFLLNIAADDFPLFRHWFAKAVFIVGFCTIAEFLQYFGIYALGITFDLFDIVMYCTGVALAVILDRLILKRIIHLWD